MVGLQSLRMAGHIDNVQLVAADHQKRGRMTVPRASKAIAASIPGHAW
ncbi:hypothetical protein [Propionivibrio sp.]